MEPETIAKKKKKKVGEWGVCVDIRKRGGHSLICTHYNLFCFESTGAFWDETV